MTMDHSGSHSRNDDSAACPPDEGKTPITLRSDELLRGEREILIQHASDIYRLRITRNGKLILTK